MMPWYGRDVAGILHVGANVYTDHRGLGRTRPPERCECNPANGRLFWLDFEEVLCMARTSPRS